MRRGPRREPGGRPERTPARRRPGRWSLGSAGAWLASGRGPCGCCGGGPGGGRGGGRGGAPGEAKAGPLEPGQRWSVARKREVALRMLRGEPLEALSRELGVEAYRLAEWRL